MLKTIIAVSLVLMAGGLSAQECKTDSISPTQKVGQYLDNGDGTVTDIVNGMVWMKCSLGQEVVEGQCTGSPTHYPTWSEALIAGNDNIAFGNAGDFRLPNIKELASLVERACFGPAINLEAFPSTPSAIYWSNTPDDQVNANVGSGILGRLIDFSDGTEYLTDVNRHRLVRLVKKL